MRTALVITGKDLRRQLRNGTLLLFAVLLPLGIAVLFSTALGEGNFQARYVVADEDGGPAAAMFADSVLGVLAADPAFDISRVDSAAAAVDRVEAGDAHAAFVIPAGFSADVEAGRDATLQVIGAADAEIAPYVAREIALGYATEVRSVRLAVALTRAGGVAVDDPEQLARRLQAEAAPLVVARDATADRSLGTETYYSAGMAAFFVFFVVMLSVQSLLAERGDGTMARILSAPAPRPAILVGKLLGAVVTGGTAMTVLVVTSSLLLGASWGSPWGVAALAGSLVLAATGLMFLIASLAGKPEHATGWMAPLAVLMGMFGGTFAPLAQVDRLAVVSYATPHRWFLQGLSDLAGGGWQDALVPAAVLLGVGVGTLTLTLLRVGKLVAP